MQHNKDLIFFIMGALLAVVWVAGCTISPAATVTTTAQPPTVPTTLPATTSEMTKIPATTAETMIPTAVQVPAVKEILHEKGILTTKTFSMYDFKAMGFKFVYPGDTFRITITAEQPVLGYAIDTEQVSQMGSAQLTPHYVSYSKKVQWGLVDPSFVLEKATDSTEEFIYGNYIRADKDGVDKVWTTGEVHPLTYIVDGRWMGFDPAYDNVQSFAYEITITKTGGPTKQSFDFYNATPQF